MGQIKALITTETEITPMQQKLEKIARDMGKIAFILATTTFLVLIIRFLIEMGQDDKWNESQEYIQIVNFLLLAVILFKMSKLILRTGGSFSCGNT